MRIIDAHHHLWDLDRLSYPWLEEPIDHLVGDYSPIRRNYRPADLLADAEHQKLVKSVHLQAEIDHGLDPAEETAWLQGLADAPGSGGFPHGIVAFADLGAGDLEAVLARHRAHANLRGIRQMLNHGPEPRLCFTDRGDLMDDPRWRAGFALLERHDLSFDLQIWPWQMERAARLAEDLPQVQIILNHTGMPMERTAEGFAQWLEGMAALAGCPSVAVKISGLGMLERDWTSASIRPYVLDTIELFGVERCLFASNFPVDKLMSDYDKVWDSYAEITAAFSADERRALFHDNAERYYRL